MPRVPVASFTERQRAAVAKVACAVAQPGDSAVVCGPRGVGKTSVVAAALDHDAGAPVAWLQPVDGRLAAPPSDAAVVVVDDAHDADVPALAALVQGWRARSAAAALVLVGEGRLLTLLSRDPRLEHACGLRAVVHPFTFDETIRAVAEVLGDAVAGGVESAAVQAIHDIAAGIPAEVVRLAGFVRVVAVAAPTEPITTAVVEAVHRRLSLQAA